LATCDGIVLGKVKPTVLLACRNAPEVQLLLIVSKLLKGNSALHEMEIALCKVIEEMIKEERD
jgi:hypothetical protein